MLYVKNEFAMINYGGEILTSSTYTQITVQPSYYDDEIYDF